MAHADFIPAGRTSRIVKGPVEIQIQTEYAYRPNARLTTSIISNGQVLRKIQQELPAPVSSIEEKTRIEDLLRKQHIEVLQIIRSQDFSLDSLSSQKRPLHEKKATLSEKLTAVEGVERIIRIDAHTEQALESLPEPFRKRYSAVIKNLAEVVNIFSQLPGGKREKGLVEIEPDRLYVLSSGLEFYFLLVRPDQSGTPIEQRINAVLGK
jgi:hypothetical protein